MAAGHGPDGIAPADVRTARGPHAASAHRCWSCRGRSRPSITPSSADLLAAQSDHDFQTAKVNGRTGNTVHTDRGDLSAPVVVDALGWRRVLGSGYQPPGRPALTRPGGPSLGRRRGDGAVDRPQVRAGGLRLELPGRRRDAHRRGLVRPALPREGHDGDAGRGPRARAGALPGQLDPAQAAGRHRRRRLLRGRLGRPLPAAHRRGDQDRALFRDRLRPRAARRRGGPAVDRVGAGAATATSRRPTAGSSRRCWPPRGWSRASPHACCTARSGRCRRSASWTGASATTSGIAPPEFATAAPPPRKARRIPESLAA